MNSACHNFKGGGKSARQVKKCVRNESRYRFSDWVTKRRMFSSARSTGILSVQGITCDECGVMTTQPGVLHRQMGLNNHHS